MILIALGANLDSEHGMPSETLRAAVTAIAAAGITATKKSDIWRTAPVPFDADQNWYHNAVIAVETNMSPQDLLVTLLKIESDFGRVRTVENAPRVLDLDIIAYNQLIIEEDDLIIPHPRLHERLFVLKPLQDITPDWLHPKTGEDVPIMINKYGDNQQAMRHDKL